MYSKSYLVWVDLFHRGHSVGRIRIGLQFNRNNVGMGGCMGMGMGMNMGPGQMGGMGPMGGYNSPMNYGGGWGGNPNNGW